MSFVCEYCNNIFTTKNHLLRHNKSETCIKIQKILINANNEYNTKLLAIENINKELMMKIQTLNEENNTLKTEIKTLEKEKENYRKIVEKAATKSTNTIKNNYQHNNYLNYISSEPIKFSNLKNQLKNVVTPQSIMYDDEDFHNHIVDNIFKDKNGKDKLLCTDINRKNFTYKDEKSGELVSDPELEKLREQLKRGTDIKLLRRDLLEKLVQEYEDNGSVGIDPYKKFSDIIQKLNFGSPFVDHVAKKTYVKTKSNNDDTETDDREIEEIDKMDEKDIKEIEEIDNKEVTEVIEKVLSTEEFKEYKQLYEEFKNDV
uniref:C2H2-type domain-containing protein n=1 Tax=viral metagenome TaxID=1070528 RepID=A0A6C0I751_9ZZZZ